jgi:hypothetical protein
MSTQDDDELKLEPPKQRPQPPATNPQPEVPDVPKDEYGNLEPGRGRPMVEGPPMSVGEAAPDPVVNRTAAFAGLGVIGIVAIGIVILLLIVILGVCAIRH